MLAEGFAISGDCCWNAFCRYKALAGTAEPAVLIWRQKSFGLVHEEAVGVGEVGEDVLLETEDFVLLAVLRRRRPSRSFRGFRTKGTRSFEDVRFCV